MHVSSLCIFDLSVHPSPIPPCTAATALLAFPARVAQLQRELAAMEAPVALAETALRQVCVCQIDDTRFVFGIELQCFVHCAL